MKNNYVYLPVLENCNIYIYIGMLHIKSNWNLPETNEKFQNQASSCYESL